MSSNLKVPIPDAGISDDAEVQPEVSVLMPVFNAERYVAAALESILAQSFRDFEFIVLDDGSSDSSLQILQTFAIRDARVRVTSRSNRGLVSTLNEMISMARGGLIARMDADDIAFPERLHCQVSFMQQHPEVVAVGSRAVLVDPDGLPLRTFIDNFTHDAIVKAMLSSEVGIVHPAAMIRRRVLECIGGYRSDFRHAEDLDLFLRLSEVGRLANIAEPLLRYRMNPTSVSHEHFVEQSVQGRRAVAAAVERMGLAPGVQPLTSSTQLVAPSKAQLHRKWSWWALEGGNLLTARKHALIATAAEPFSRQNFKLLVCVARDCLRAIR